jgi:hypothetical protein
VCNVRTQMVDKGAVTEDARYKRQWLSLLMS